MIMDAIILQVLKLADWNVLPAMIRLKTQEQVLVVLMPMSLLTECFVLSLDQPSSQTLNSTEFHRNALRLDVLCC